MGIDLQLDKLHSLQETSAITQSGTTSAAVTWSKGRADSDDPIAMSLKLSASQSQDRQFEIDDEMPWASANFNWQQQYGKSIYEPSLQGALALVGGNVYTTRSVSEDESFGVLQIPGASNVRVEVNGSHAGSTNAKGELLLRNLQPYSMNSVEVDATELPIWYNLDDPLEVVPRKGAPIRLSPISRLRGGFSLIAVDEHGVPLAAASDLTLGTRRYPVGYDGRVYIPSMALGCVRFYGVANGATCTIEITAPRDPSGIPDLGPQRCRLRIVDATP